MGRVTTIIVGTPDVQAVIDILLSDKLKAKILEGCQSGDYKPTKVDIELISEYSEKHGEVVVRDGVAMLVDYASCESRDESLDEPHFFNTWGGVWYFGVECLGLAEEDGTEILDLERISSLISKFKVPGITPKVCVEISS